MMYTIRNVSTRTKERLNRYAEDHSITIAEALGQLVEYGSEYYEQHRKSPKKFRDLKSAMKEMPSW
jgi:hypothetical protein